LTGDRGERGPGDDPLPWQRPATKSTEWRSTRQGERHTTREGRNSSLPFSRAFEWIRYRIVKFVWNFLDWIGWYVTGSGRETVSASSSSGRKIRKNSNSSTGEREFRLCCCSHSRTSCSLSLVDERDFWSLCSYSFSLTFHLPFSFAFHSVSDMHAINVWSSLSPGIQVHSLVYSFILTHGFSLLFSVP
jgi:hypothetical protein